MSQERLRESPKKMGQRIARTESHPASAQSFPRRLHPILQLQRTVGNRAAGHLIQAKLAARHPGDLYERQADRVAEQVTPLAQRKARPKEEKKEEPLVRKKPLAESSTPLAQRQMIQLDKGGQRRGPLPDPPGGMDADKASKTISPGDAPKGGEEKEGASFFPVLDKVNATIAGVQKFAGVVQQLTHNNTVSARFEFPALVSEKSVVFDELQRIHNNLMAQKICDQAFDFAANQGVDLKNLDAQGKVKKAVAPAPAPGPLAPKLPAGSVFEPPPAPARAPAGGVKAAGKEVFDEDDVARLATTMGRLEQLAASDMKSEVDIAVKKMVVAVPKALPKATFWWDGDNNKGYAPMTDADLTRTILGSAHGCYGVFEASVTVSQIPGGAMGGMPKDVKYFQLKPSEVKYNPLWITGGGIDVHQHEDVSVSVTSTPDENLYDGAYRVKSTWKWDESTTFFDCNVTNFGASFTGIRDPDPQGVADDGWF